MEIPQPSEPPRAHRADLISAGLLTAVVGMLVAAWWPFLLIALGAIRLVSPEPSGSHGGRHRGRSGAWLIVVGLWGLVNEAHLFGFDYGSSWPLLVIAVGAMMVWGTLDAGCGPRVRREP
jgi:hypothetical protein